jgi:hypothetical protein
MTPDASELNHTNTTYGNTNNNYMEFIMKNKSE